MDLMRIQKARNRESRFNLNRSLRPHRRAGSMFSNNPVSSSLVPTTIVPKAQFRAVILCGYGSDLFPLIETNNELFDDDEEYEGEGERAESVESEEDGPPLTGIGAALARGAPGAGTTPALAQAKIGQVKALLPVGGRKMIDWVLDRVEEAGVYGSFVPSRS